MILIRVVFLLRYYQGLHGQIGAATGAPDSVVIHYADAYRGRQVCLRGQATNAQAYFGSSTEILPVNGNELELELIKTHRGWAALNYVFLATLGSCNPEAGDPVTEKVIFPVTTTGVFSNIHLFVKTGNVCELQSDSGCRVYDIGAGPVLAQCNVVGSGEAAVFDRSCPVFVSSGDSIFEFQLEEDGTPEGPSFIVGYGLEFGN